MEILFDSVLSIQVLIPSQSASLSTANMQNLIKKFLSNSGPKYTDHSNTKLTDIHRSYRKQ